MSFSDLVNNKGAPHWSAVYIKDIAEKGLVSGYSDGTFRPNSPVSGGCDSVHVKALSGGTTKDTYADNKAKWTAKLNTYDLSRSMEGQR